MILTIYELDHAFRCIYYIHVLELAPMVVKSQANSLAYKIETEFIVRRKGGVPRSL